MPGGVVGEIAHDLAQQAEVAAHAHGATALASTSIRPTRAQPPGLGEQQVVEVDVGRP